MNIVLLILKILGLTLAGIAALVLLLLLLLLFVPFRYRARVLKQEQPLSGEARLTWLLHAVTLRYVISEEKNAPELRIFGVFKKELKFEERKTAEKEPEAQPEKKEKKSLTERWEALKENLHKLEGFTEDGRIQDAFSFLYRKLGSFLKAVAPKKLKGYAEFGLSSPYSTAMLTVALTTLFPLYGDSVRVLPDMQEEKLDCDFKVLGRVFLFRIAFIGLSVILNRNVRYLIRTYQHNFGNRKEH